MASNNMYSKEQFLIRTSTQADNVYQNQQQQQYHHLEMIVSQSCNTSITNTSSRLHPHTPNTEPKLCTQQAPAKAEIIRTIKYVLIHQNLGVHGEIVTDFVQVKFMKKMEHFYVCIDYGDVFPSSTGAVNVIFNSEERVF
ncbi:unnamed protein product [Adineta ricciae]|uniref:Uncharacterized protein n=1 Tax=Adineta ricciae TaxID=249248 RepID=A0A814YXE1_ADIRI|nr:unnamed protein product [Adineta ricciae]CAF1242867.1 unnamed protein product [Adineta ricciae]